MTVTLRSDGVNISVHGFLDQLSSRALVEAVDTALVADGRVVIDLDGSEGFTSDAIRDLATCANLGALLRFNAPPCVEATPS